MQASEEKQERIVQIGPDRVAITANEVVIESKHPMADWDVRDFNAAPIYFEDHKYILVEKCRVKPPYAMRYRLRPWPEGQSASAKRFHTYDAEAVAQRDSAHRSGIRDEIIRMVLLPLYPILGLLWSPIQRWLNRFGILPRSITSISIFTVFCLFFAQGVFAAVSINATIRTGRLMVGGLIRAMSTSDHFSIGSWHISIMWLDCLLTLAFVADVAIRYSNYLRDDQWVGGFLEWMLPRFTGPKKAGETD